MPSPEQHGSVGSVKDRTDLAGAINRGELSVAEAYATVFSRPGGAAGIRVVAPPWRTSLPAVASQLEDAKFHELLDLVTSEYFARESRLSFDTPEGTALADQLLLAGEMLRSRRDVCEDHPAVERVLMALVEEAQRYTDFEPGEYTFCQRCVEVITASRSVKVAFACIDFVLWCARVPDLGYPIDDSRFYARCRCADAAVEIARTHHEAIESHLIEYFARTHESPEKDCLLSIMGSIGSRRSFEALCTDIGTGALTYYSRFTRSKFWRTVFGIVERHGFPRGMMEQLNGELARRVDDAEFMALYHRCLSEYARSFASKGERLFDVLEATGVQFWDYWIVYQDV